MSVISQLRSVIRATLGLEDAERELDAEVQAYLELLIEEKRSAGLTETAARRAALLELRGADQVKEAVRDARATAAVDALVRDVRHAIRGLRRQPGLTITALATLALAVGGATGIFSVVDAVLLRPLPGVRDPDRLVTFSRIQPSGTYDNFSLPDFRGYAAGAPAFGSVSAHVGAVVSAGIETSAGTAAGGEPARRLRADLVTGGYFATLGVTPLRGRLLDAGDDAPAVGDRVAVLSEGMWRSDFGAAADVVGRTIRLNGAAFRVVGVAQGGFTGTAIGRPVDLWLPLAARPIAMPRMSEGIEDDRAAGWMQVFGRLRPGATLTDARAQLSVVSAQLARAYPLTNADRRVGLTPGLGLYPDDRAEIAGTLRLLFGAVMLVVLIACANVAGLLLVRFGARQHEMAARLALGGGPGRLIRQTLVEGLVLALAAGALGLVLARFVAVLATAAQPPSSVLHELHVTLSVRVLAFALASAIVTGLLVAVLPALRAARLTPMVVLRQGGRGAAPRRARTQRALVGGQVSLSFAMLFVSSMLLVGLYRIVTAPPGFETRDVAMLSLDLGSQGYTRERGEALLHDVLTRAAAVPGTRSVSLGTGGVPPTDCLCRVSVFHPGEVPPPEVFHGRSLELGVRPAYAAVAPRFFATLGIPIVQGRDFTDADRSGGPSVAIVNESLAQRLWPGKDPIGRRIVMPPWEGPIGPPLEVIGVAGDTRWRSLTEPVPPVLYAPLWQNYDGQVTLVARSARPSGALAELRAAIADVDPGLATYREATMAQHLAASLWQQRMIATWVIVFGIVALALGAVGLYGVLAQSVIERTNELSIRLALGASPKALIALVVREGALLGTVGLAFGIPAALLFGRITSRLVTGVALPDAAALVGVAALLGVVVLFAAYLPARRASGIDAVEPLRYP